MKTGLYEGTKSIVKKLLPKRGQRSLIKRIRWISSLAFQGSQHQCCLCSFKLSKFIESGNGNLICPRCGGTERARSIWYIFNQKFTEEELRILHFSPNPALRENFETWKVKNFYESSDYASEFDADLSYDICHIDQGKEHYDLIICMHILEHIVEDVLAMKELFRVLKTGGSCLIQTPFKEGDIYENPSIITPSERLIHFGQEDHVRIYSKDGLVRRLTSVGFEVETISFDEKITHYHGLTRNPILQAFKKVVYK